MGIRRGFAVLLCAVSWTGGTAAAVLQARPLSDRDGTSQTSADLGPWLLRPDGAGAIITGSGFSGGFYRSALEFDIRGVYGKGPISQAVMTFHIDLIANQPAAYRTHGYVGDGVVAAQDLDVNNEIAPIQTTSDPAQVDVTAYLQALAQQNASYLGIVLSGFPGGKGFSITSSEPFVNSPILTITTIPEPATTLGIPLAFASTLAARRRRRRHQ